ncbi:MAG: acyl-CoA thioester hydrolase/BAAT C-terminal domain-containing protein [Gammaproteobacteria bacterium]
MSFVHVPFDPDRRSFKPPATTTDPLFAYERHAVRVDNHLLDELETPNYRIRELAFPSVGENGQEGNLVTARYFQSKEPGRKPLVIVLPIWGTHEYPSDKTVSSFRKRSRGDISILALMGEDFLIDWPALAAARSESAFRSLADEMAERLVTTVIDIRRVIDWAEQQPDVDASRIGLVAFSLGAVVGASVVTNEPRIAATVLVMGAVDAGKIFAHCDGRVATVRQAVMPRFDWTLEEYEAVMDAAFAAGDAANFPGRVDPAHALMIDSKNDNCMPESTRDQLWEVLGRPERISFRYSHKQAFLAMTPLGFNFTSRRIFNFMNEQLAPKK